MKSSCVLAILIAVLSGPLLSQVQVYYPDSNPAIGAGPNSFPFSVSNFSSVHFYSANALLAAGVAPGAGLIDFAVASSGAGSNTYSTPVARFVIGHLLYDTPQPTLWEAHLDNPVVVHDLASGPYSFPWTGATWVSLPGVLPAGFVWDGVRDIGVYYTCTTVAGGTTVRTSPSDGRFGVTVHNATTQVPTTTGYFAMKARLTFTGNPVTMNTPGASLTFNGVPGPVHLYGNDPLNVSITSTTALGNPFFVFFSPSYTGGHLPFTGQSLDLGHASAFFADVFSIGTLGIQPLLTGVLAPFGVLDPTGNFSLPLGLACTGAAPRTFFQVGILDATAVPDGFRITGISSFDVEASCRYAATMGLPVAIPDGGAAVTATTSVPFGTPISDVDVLIDITHAQISDLSITLSLAGGPTVQLLTPQTPVDNSDLNGVYQFSDEAQISIDTAAIQSGTLILPGRFGADNSLSAFDFLDAGGMWTLTVQDTVAANVGTLRGFSILLNGLE
jgi:subtilisin-like proprotein convertase family protein